MPAGPTGICGGAKAAALAIAFKLIDSAQRRWRMVNAPHLVALVRADATFVSGKLTEYFRVGDHLRVTLNGHNPKGQSGWYIVAYAMDFSCYLG